MMEYGKNRSRRNRGQFSGPSYLEPNYDSDYNFGSGYVDEPMNYEDNSNLTTHYMPGDKSKIFDPETGKYVRIDRPKGQKIMSKYGYPAQEGGFDFGTTLSDLYDDLKSTWNSLFAGSAHSQITSSIPQSYPDTNQNISARSMYAANHAPEHNMDYPKRTTTKRSTMASNKSSRKSRPLTDDEIMEEIQTAPSEQIYSKRSQASTRARTARAPRRRYD